MWIRPQDNAGLIDDQWANQNTVIKEGLHLRGEWATGQLFVHGEELHPVDWEEREKPWGQLRNPTSKFRWGEDSPANNAAVLAILQWFLDDHQLELYLEDFTTDIVAELPREDFEMTINYERWRNELLHRRPTERIIRPDHSL